MLSDATFRVVGKDVHPSIRKPAAGPGTLSRIGAVHCPVHDQNARAVLKETKDGGLNFEIQVRCDVIIEEVKRLLGA
jgi:hypothetical protein